MSGESPVLDCPTPMEGDAQAKDNEEYTCSTPGCNATGYIHGQGGSKMIVQRPATATAKASVKCHLCNKGKCAIKRVLDEDADIKEEFFDVCDADARNQVVGRVKDGSFLPSAVKKEIVEAIQWAKIQQKTSNFQADGEFFTEKELDDLVEQGKLEKDDLRALLDMTPREIIIFLRKIHRGAATAFFFFVETK